MKQLKILKILGTVIPVALIVLGAYMAGMKMIVESQLLSFGLIVMVLGCVSGYVLARIIKKLEPPQEEKAEAKNPEAVEEAEADKD